MFKNPPLIDIKTKPLTPGEVETLTGLNLSTLRGWRRKGWVHKNAMLGSVHGYHLADLCEVALLNAFFRSGGSVATLQSFSSAMAGHVYQWVLGQPAVWDTADHFAVYRDEKAPANLPRFGCVSAFGIRSFATLDDQFKIDGPPVATVIDYAALASSIVDGLNGPFATMTVHDLVERDGRSFFVNRFTGKVVE
jgi:hypothetical protein